MTKQEILALCYEVNNLKRNETNTLPRNSYFLDENRVVCFPSKFGNSRYPYYEDGMTLFANTSGYIDCTEGQFNIFRCQHYNEDTPVAFFIGEPFEGKYFPYSVTGVARQLFEAENIVRYTVFTNVCAYYITETEKAIFSLKTYIGNDKHIKFSCGVVNKSEKRNVYIASYFEPMLRPFSSENFFHRMTKYGQHFENGSFIISAINEKTDLFVINSKTEGKIIKKYATTSKKTVLGLKGANLTNALAFKNGFFDAEINKTNTTDLPCAADIIHFELDEDGYVGIDYDIVVTNDEKYEELLQIRDFEPKYNYEAPTEFNISFTDWIDSKLNSEVLNKFLKFVERQVSFCALGKSYAGSMLGIRDVFQQLESSLMWCPEKSREQIVKVMNYIIDTGRAPRQISFVDNTEKIPDLDLRPFIDQGFWIISTIYSYLAFTGDKAILDEKCGYYSVEGYRGKVSKSPLKDSLLCHIIRITDYLISNIDTDTGCVKALWGDWNDALDGLGKTEDEDKEFGNGVSVMATQQLYLAIEQMCDILEHYSKNEELIIKYRTIQNKLSADFKKYAVSEKNTDVRIMHGWGDKRSYFVGSFNDYDGEERLSLTANSFFAISGLCEKYPEYKENIADNIMSLDSKYGLLTFDKPFKDFSAKIGRLSTITPGTYENACSYVHAGTFGAMALFVLNRSEEAWKILEKLMVITHENPTYSTFVMPNSYCYNEEYSIDGDSMGDWHTGSGTVLIKEIVRYGFGIIPTLDGVTINPPKFFPAKLGEIKLKIKGKNFVIKYINNSCQGIQVYHNNNIIEGPCFLQTEAFEEENEILIKM